jgi:membrane fusion protein, multidrug efflux system
MARVIVSLADPFGLEAEGEEAGTRPLLAGSYVEVEILAKEVASAVEIPRVALRDGGQVFVMDDDERLEIREVSVGWRDRDTVLVDEGLRDGDRVIVSPVPAPASGMRLRRLAEGDDVAASGAEPE